MCANREGQVGLIATFLLAYTLDSVWGDCIRLSRNVKKSPNKAARHLFTFMKMNYACNSSSAIINNGSYLQARQEIIKSAYLSLLSVQQQARSSLWRISISVTLFFHIFFYTKVVFSLPLTSNFSTSFMRDITTTKYTVVVHLTAGNRQLVLFSRSPIIYRQHFRCLENGPGCKQKSCLCL